jgi:hypothetical protein
MTKREPLMSDTYLGDRVRFLSEEIQEILDDIPTCFDKQAAWFTVLRRRLALLYTHYSAGYPIELLRTDLLAVVTSWEDLRAIEPRDLYDISFKNDLTNYVESLGMLSIAYLIRLEPEAVSRLLACVGNEGQDLLFERLVAVGGHGIGRKPAKKLLYPKAYQPLYDALDASTEQRATLVKQFLGDWYKRIKAVGWHNSHKGPEGGGFKGYWCWEAAGVALAFSINDSSFRDLPYYPKDLADFARTNG